MRTLWLALIVLSACAPLGAALAEEIVIEAYGGSGGTTGSSSGEPGGAGGYAETNATYGDLEKSSEKETIERDATRSTERAGHRH
ncbi:MULTISPECIES: hypothetical protein [Sinorhizobium]|uniref:hypothetical protein n=1 Tax=Sinorhizobium TaxID=28105 RepID=UPI000BE88BC1|nr:MULTISPECIES: hypothetical protein [Sinorhizobium]